VRAIGKAVLAACLAAALPPAAAAQSPADNRPVRRLEVAVGGGLFGGAALGEEDANLRANSAGSEPFRLFATESVLTRAPGLDVRAAWSLSRRYSVEGTFSFGRPELQTSISSDAEGAPPLVVVEWIDQYLIDAGLVVMLDELRIGSIVPVVAGGVGYARQLHEGRTLIENGYFVHVGGGLRHWLFTRGRGLLKGAGLRGDARLVILDDAVAVDDSPRSHGAISGGLFVVF
jgi:hypothetical protein